MTADAPALSVLIASRDRASLLAALLHSLERARLASSAMLEVVVVDNGSTDGTAALLDEWVGGGPGRVRLPVAQPGKSRALNVALQVARANVLAFTDDDVEVAPTYVEEILAFCAAQPQFAAAIGRVLAPPNVTDPDVLRRLDWYRTVSLFDHGDAVREESSLHGSNMVLRRATCERIGGFDERLGPGVTGGMEDQELGERIVRAGLRIGYMPRVVVYHSIDPTRLTPAYFRLFQQRQAISRFAMDPHGAWRRALPRLIESAAGFAWWSLRADPLRREHARGRMLRNAAIVRLYFRARRQLGAS